MSANVTVTVTTQVELDAALVQLGNDGSATIVIASTGGVWLALAPPTRQCAVVRVDSGGRVDRVDNGGWVDRVDNGGWVGSVVNGGWVGSVVNGGRVGSVDNGGRVGRVDNGGWVSSVVNGGRVDRVDNGGWVSSVVNGGWVGSVVSGGRVDRVDSGGWVGSVDNGGWVSSVVNGGRVDRAAGAAVVHLYKGGELKRAGSHVSVYVHHQQVAVNGGVVIDMTDLDLLDPVQWCAYHGIEIETDGRAVVYKAVDVDLNAGQIAILTAYPIGSTVTATDWCDDHKCGGGLHFSPSPIQAKGYFRGGGEPRFLRCLADVGGLRSIDDKIKVREAYVDIEVDVHGDPIEVSR